MRSFGFSGAAAFFVFQAVEGDAGVEAVVHVAAFVADFKLVAFARFEQVAVGAEAGLRRVELGEAGVEAVVVVQVVNCACVAGELGFAGFVQLVAFARFDFVVSQTPAADERQPVDRMEDGFAVNAEFVKVSVATVWL